jgi:hypothetical protein
MQHSAQPPQQHARRHPSDHAILAAQRSPGGLEGDEEGEEEGYGRVEVALVESNIGREVPRLGIANLLDVSAWSRQLGRFAELALDLSSELNRNSSARKGSSSVSSFSSVRLCRREFVVCCPSSSFSSMVRAEARGTEMVESSWCSWCSLMVGMHRSAELHHKTTPIA